MKPFLNLKSRLGMLAMLGVLLFTRTGLAAVAPKVSLGDVSGQPGDTLVVSLDIDGVPLDADGLFALDLNVTFDSSRVAILGVSNGSLNTLDYLVDVTPSGLTSSPLSLSVLGIPLSSSNVPATLGPGSLAEIDVEILAGAAPGDQIALVLSYNKLPEGGASTFELGSGNVDVSTVIPLPAAIWFMLGALGMLAGTVRRRPAS